MPMGLYYIPGAKRHLFLSMGGDHESCYRPSHLSFNKREVLELFLESILQSIPPLSLHPLVCSAMASQAHHSECDGWQLSAL
jgi:hypothetical protein